MHTVPLTPAQSGVWFTEQLADMGSAYHMALSMTLEGELDVSALSAAVAEVCERHPVLGAAILVNDGEPSLRLGVHRITLRHTASAPDLAEPFGLRTGGPLARAWLQTLEPERHVLTLVAHHLVFDGQSKEVFVRDLARAYRGELNPTGPDAYRDAVVTELKVAAELLESARAHWAGRWNQPTEVLLPEGGGVEGQGGGKHKVCLTSFGAGSGTHLNVPVPAGLADVASTLGVTVFELVLAALHVVLHGYGNENVTVAVDVGTRSKDGPDLIGLFVNEIPATTVADGRSTLPDLAADLRTQLRAAYRFRSVPLARAAAVPPGAALSPISVSYRRQGRSPDFPGLAVHIDWSVFGGTIRGALQVLMVDTEGKLDTSLRYDPRLVPAATAALVAAHLTAVLEGGLAPAPHGPETLNQLLLTGRQRDPDAVALTYDGSRLTYRDLHVAANRLAHRLRRAGVGPGCLVGVGVDRSADAVAAVLAVLKAGAAYLPLDPRFPEERLTFIVSDAAPAALILPSRQSPLAADTPIIALDEMMDGEDTSDPCVDVRPGDPAYVIYTSGSTGRPKGVEVPHRAIVNLVRAMHDELDAGPSDVWLALTSLSFDISALELFLPLAIGGTAVVAPQKATRDGAALHRLIADHGVTHVQATPSSWELLLEAGIDAPGLTALCGGEALPPSLAVRLLGRVGRLVNVYGPTETTVWSTLGDVTSDAVTIGRAIAGTTTFVLDPNLRRVPMGELYISGRGVASHYLNRPALTAESFVPNPYGPPGSRLYRTGDEVRLDNTGALVFLGRRDHQVKIRGHRVELGEIEAHLTRHPEVHQAVVKAYDRHLAAYLVAPAPPASRELRAFLGQSLPQHMIPHAFVVLDRMPLTPNGKIDRNALPSPVFAPGVTSAGCRLEERSTDPDGLALSRQQRGEAAPPSISAGCRLEERSTDPDGLALSRQQRGEAAPPAITVPEADDVTKQVAKIWCEVLGIHDVGLDADLFDLGGHSLTITRIAARLRDRLDVDVPVFLLWNATTVTAMAALVREGAGA